MADAARVKTSRALTNSCLSSMLSKDIKEGWRDGVREEDGGMDIVGNNMQHEIGMMKEQMDNLEMAINEGRAWDDVSGMELELEKVKQARKEEMQFFAKGQDYTRCRREQILIEGGKLIDVRWIDVNKGDADNNTYKDDTLYA